MDETPARNSSKTVVALGLVFFSGFAALIYQVLWMKQIGLLFGNTSHAAAATLASFFAGLAVGSWFLGRRVSTSTSPMRTYAWLEVSIALTALIYFGILSLFHAIYPSIYQSVGSGALLLIIKFLLSLLLVFPPAFCMGGTIPVIGQYMVRERTSFGKISALMYGVNTLGAAIGAALAGFYLPLWLGFNATCGLAIVISLVVAAIAFALSRNALPPMLEEEVVEVPKEEEAKVDDVKLSRQERRRLDREGRKKSPKIKESVPAINGQPAYSRKLIMFLCFLSGFGVLSLEVLWTRMFTQVLENSVYTFAAILVVVLVCLAVGALVSSQLAKLKVSPDRILLGLLVLGSWAIAETANIFMALTNDMELLVSKGAWSSYISLIFKTAFLTIGPSAIILGTIFPFLMKVEERHVKSPGLSLGRLAAANTIGAILGALLCGFLLLDWLGMWRSMQVTGMLYIFAALVLSLKSRGRRAVISSVFACVICFSSYLIILKPDKLPVTSTDPNKPPEKLVEVWEGSDCTVSVTDGVLGRAIKINSDYSLGSTGAYMQERFQSELPLMALPQTEDVFFLGVGTGITAGSALDSQAADIKKIVACELSPDVITAARKYMTRYQGYDLTSGLFDDSRAEVLIEDGRHYLMATDEKFDMINADLFVPFRSGAGSLYTKEHFESAKERLNPDGVFVQWLPLYQLTEYEFSVIAKTMIGVFDQVSLWRHNFQPGYEVVALMGHHAGHALPPSDIESLQDKLYAVSGKNHHDLMRLNLPLNPKTILLFYGGNLTEANSLFDEYPVNTDNRPIIEYMAPRSYRSADGKETPWFVGEPFVNLVEKVQELCPPQNDPLLVNRTPANQRLPLAGNAFHRARISQVKGDEASTKEAWQKFVSDWTENKPDNP